MAKPTGPKRTIAVRLIHDGVQPGKPLDEPLKFGMPDTKSGLHAGARTSDGRLSFDCVLDVKGVTGVGAPAFAGPFAHGPPSTRFLYLGWKRPGNPPAPWGWRIKIPLSGIAWSDIEAAGPTGRLEADVVGRKPHTSVPIAWRTVSGQDSPDARGAAARAAPA